MIVPMLFVILRFFRIFFYKKISLRLSCYFCCSGNHLPFSGWMAVLLPEKLLWLGPLVGSVPSNIASCGI